jgi:hypothetical protein
MAAYKTYMKHFLINSLSILETTRDTSLKNVSICNLEDKLLNFLLRIASDVKRIEILILNKAKAKLNRGHLKMVGT